MLKGAHSIMKSKSVLVALVLAQLVALFNAFRLFMNAAVTDTSFSSLKSNHQLQNDLIIRAAKGEKVERTPIWVFRQAGRHLPEYNEYKKTKGKNFLELLNDPADVCECTMQPIRRYDLDAAILFSDILVILQAMEIEVTMPGGLGIQVPQPITSPNDFYNRVPKTIDVREKLSHVISAVKLIKNELNGKVPLIGFSAAPWTLFYYLVGGSSRKNQQTATSWLANHAQDSAYILDYFTDVIIDYLSAQVDAGADLLQVFEAMGEYINDSDFFVWALPRLSRIASTLKARYPNVPLMVFPRGVCTLRVLAALEKCGYDVVSIDTKTDRVAARSDISCSLQGNMEVSLLAGDDPSNSPSKVKAEVQKMLKELGPQKFIANLGEGLLGKESPELVKAFIDSVHEVSAEMIKTAAQK